MSGPPVSVGCAVVLTPGAAGAPDSGVISLVLQTTVSAGGLPLATTGSMCQLVNSVSGAPYMLPIGTVGASTGATVDGQALVRMGDMIATGPGMLQVIGPPAAPFLSDGNAP